MAKKSDDLRAAKVPDGQLLPDELFNRLRLDGPDSPWLSTYWLTGYHSDGPHLPLEEFVQEAQKHIRRHYEHHLEPRTGVSFEKFWEDVRQVQYQKWPDCNASFLAMMVGESALDDRVAGENMRGAKKEPKDGGPMGLKPLYVAGAFYFEALRAFQSKLRSRTWAALLMCHHFIGIAHGQESMVKRSSKGGKTTSAPFAEFYTSFRQELLSWLKDLEVNPAPKRFQTRKEVIDELFPRASAFAAKWTAEREDPRGRSSELRVLMRDCTRDPEVRAAFETVMGKRIFRGRPLGSSSKTASKNKTRS